LDPHGERIAAGPNRGELGGEEPGARIRERSKVQAIGIGREQHRCGPSHHACCGPHAVAGPESAKFETAGITKVKAPKTAGSLSWLPAVFFLRISFSKLLRPGACVEVYARRSFASYGSSGWRVTSLSFCTVMDRVQSAWPRTLITIRCRTAVSFSLAGT